MAEHRCSRIASVRSRICDQSICSIPCQLRCWVVVLKKGKNTDAMVRIEPGFDCWKYGLLRSARDQFRNISKRGIPSSKISRCTQVKSSYHVVVNLIVDGFVARQETALMY